MKKNKKIISSLCLLGVSIILSSVSVFAGPTPKPTISFVGDSTQIGRLRYGIAFSDPYKTTNATTDITKNYGVPNVQYITSDNRVIDHMYSNGKFGSPINLQGGAATTSGLNLIETEAEYTNALRPGKFDPGAIDLARDKPSAGMVKFEVGGVKKSDRLIEAVGKKTANNNFDITLKMEASADRSNVLHTFVIKNKTQETKKIYPIKQIDTMLAWNDKVPIYSRGPNKGLYIESESYRLDYITDMADGPQFYRGRDDYSLRFSNPLVFGSDKDNQYSPDMSVPAGEKVFDSTENDDTGLFLSWGAQTLAPDEEREFKYAVGITTDSSMKIKKEVTNTTRQDGTNKAGDTLEYTVTLNNKANAGSGILKKINIQDTLPKEVSDVSDIQLVKKDNSIENVPVNTAYDSTKHELNVAAPDMLGQETVKLKYKVKLNDTAKGKEVENIATVTSEDSNEIKLPPESASVKLDVLANGKVTSNYQDTNKNKLLEPKTIEGDIDAPYEVKPENIFGYKLKTTEGQTKGQFTAADQIVTFIYDKKQTYQLTQAVTDKSGNNMDKGSVALDDQLIYKAELKPDLTDLTDAQKATNYKNIQIIEKIDPNLVDVTDVKLTTASGSVVGNAVYDSASHQVTAIVTNDDNLKITESVVLTYNAKVKKQLKMGTVIKQKATSTVSYMIDDKIVGNVESNEVVTTVDKGELLIKTAPTKIDFGQVSVADFNKTVGSDKTNIDSPLVVKDTMKNQDWKVVVKLTEEMTNKGNGSKHEIPNSLYVRYKGANTTLLLNKEATIYQSDLKNTPPGQEEFNISDSWSKDENKDGLKFKGSKLPKTGKYQGTLEWSLANTQ